MKWLANNFVILFVADEYGEYSVIGEYTRVKLGWHQYLATVLY